MERFRPTPKQEAEKLGGAERDWSVYNKPDTRPYCDQKGHAERSKANQPNHKKHKLKH